MLSRSLPVVLVLVAMLAPSALGVPLPERVLDWNLPPLPTSIGPKAVYEGEVTLTTHAGGMSGRCTLDHKVLVWQEDDGTWATHIINEDALQCYPQVDRTTRRGVGSLDEGIEWRHTGSCGTSLITLTPVGDGRMAFVDDARTVSPCLDAHARFEGTLELVAISTV